jgi:hypothetical protein
LNGSFTVETLEGVNPFWQGDYGNVQFTYAPPNGRPFEGRDVFVFGEFTDFANKGKGKMTFNESKGVYETTLYMKQGYYNYTYMTLPQVNQVFLISARLKATSGVRKTLIRYWYITGLLVPGQMRS